MSWHVSGLPGDPQLGLQILLEMWCLTQSSSSLGRPGTYPDRPPQTCETAQHQCQPGRKLISLTSLFGWSGASLTRPLRHGQGMSQHLQCSISSIGHQAAQNPPDSFSCANYLHSQVPFLYGLSEVLVQIRGVSLAHCEPVGHHQVSGIAHTSCRLFSLRVLLLGPAHIHQLPEAKPRPAQRRRVQGQAAQH